MIQRDHSSIRLGMLAGLINIAKTFAGMWTGSRDADARFLLDTAIESLQKAHDLFTAPPSIEVHHD